MKTLTEKQATDAARTFLRAYVEPGYDWNMASIECCLPTGWTLAWEAESYAGSFTIKDVARYIRSNARTGYAGPIGRLR